MLQLTIWTKNDCKCIFDTKYCYQNDLRSKIIFSFFRFFQKILMYRVKNCEKKIFLKFWFLITWSILWLNSSSKTKIQLNMVTRRELGAILHSISRFVLSPSSQILNNSINMHQIWTKNDCKRIFDTKSSYQNHFWSKIHLSIFSIFSKFCVVRVKKNLNFFFFKLYFLLTRPILWLNSSSKTKFQLNRVTRGELGAILHSISWFVS